MLNIYLFKYVIFCNLRYCINEKPAENINRLLKVLIANKTFSYNTIILYSAIPDSVISLA